LKKIVSDWKKEIKIKAAVLEKLNSPLTIRDLEITELKIGQVLIRVLVSGICGSQLQEIRGFKGNEKFLPHLMGHEGCGIVEKIGPGVSRVKPGDKVVMHWRVGAGIEAEFPTYILDGKKISSGKITTLSEFSIVSENRLTKVPQETPDHLCALLGCGLTTALGVVNNEIDLKFGESVAIIGCGGVGLNLIQAACLGSAFPVIAIDLNENKRLLSLNVGADYFINSSDESVREFFDKNLPLGKIDIAIDTTGNTQIIDEISNLLSDSGRLILVGQPKPGSHISFSNATGLFGNKGKTIKTTQGGKTSPNEDIIRYIKLYNAGKLNFEKVITNVFSLDDVNLAISLLETGSAGRIIIDMRNK